MDKTIMDTSAVREQWKEQGYLVLRDAFDAARIARLHEFCEAALEQWAQESNENNQPGGFCWGPSAWVLLHLNHPRYHQEHPGRLHELLDAVADPMVLKTLREIFCEEPRFSQVGLHMGPAGNNTHRRLASRLPVFRSGRRRKGTPRRARRSRSAA